MNLTKLEPAAEPPGAAEEVLAVEGLVLHFVGRRTWTDRLTRTPVHTVKAVDGVDLTLHRGETLGLVGESGCGKSTLSRCIMGLYAPNAGDVRYRGASVVSGPTSAQRRTVQMVFQDPYSSLNPRMTVGQTLGELLRYHNIVPRTRVTERCNELMDLVGLPQESLGRRPRQFSGGQRQRIGIARALALEPEVLIADEPVSALDVSVQATIINLLLDLKSSLGLSMVFVSHNMAVVRQVSDRIAVMYRGRIVEHGPTGRVFDAPEHPYTRLLLGSVPRMAVPTEPLRPADLTAETVIEQDAPTGGATPAADAVSELGCRFRDRCPVSMPMCVDEPALIPVPAEPERAAACWHVTDAERAR